jgi:hypothetical protein
MCEEWYGRHYYIMECVTTGKRYVGQRKGSMDNYLGSGTYWINHCKSNGGYTRKNVKTLFSCWFEDEQEAKDWLKSFENKNKGYYLVENKEWANQVPETTENSPMATTDPQVIEKMKKTRKTIQESGLTIDQEKAIKASETKRNTILDNGLTIHQDTAIRSGKTQKTQEWIESKWITCEHCGKTVSPGNYKRWHGEECKIVKPNSIKRKRLDSKDEQWKKENYIHCEKCNKGPFHPANYARWHGDNCKG